MNFNGLLCDDMTALCSPNDTLFVSDHGVVVMSGSSASFSHAPAGVLDLTGGTASVTVTIGDVNSQPMAGGTTIEAEASNGKLVGPDSYTVSCTTANMPLDYVFTVEPDATSSSGPLTITVTSPSGIISIYNINVDD